MPSIPTLRFSALELSGGYYGPAVTYMPTLVQPAASGGLNAQVDVLSTHFYSSCNQTDTDTTIFSTVAEFTSEVTYMRNELKLRPDLSSLPIWVTENNVNADYQQPNGYSDCHPTQIFVIGFTRLFRLLRRVAAVRVFSIGQGRQPGPVPLPVLRARTNMARSPQ